MKNPFKGFFDKPNPNYQNGFDQLFGRFSKLAQAFVIVSFVLFGVTKIAALVLEYLKANP